MSRQEIYGVCPHDCPDTCGVLTEVENGRAVRFRGDPQHPVTAGWLCAKVNPYLEHVYHPERLRHPVRRAGTKGGGRWQRITWDRAIAEIAERWQDIRARHGAEAILPYSYSGTLGLVQMEVCNTRFWNRLGASRLLRTICGVAAGSAVQATLGACHAPPYEHVRASRSVFIWGHNPVSTAPHFMPHLRRARRQGCYVVVIDPRRTRTARGADLHVAPRPGTDAALALGMARVIVDEGLHDENWLQTNTVGWEPLRSRLADYPPERVAAITGLDCSLVIELARRYASHQPALIKIADGINRNRNGGQSVRAICALPAITGQYGVYGGGLAYTTNDYLRWDPAALHHREGCPPKGRKVNMNRLGAALAGEMRDPPILSLYVYGSNPAAIAPNARLVVEGLKREDLFTVVHEQFLTDTAELADMVLPATSQLEHTDLHRGYGHTVLAYNHAAVAPLGESKSNWEVLGLLARALGFEEPWLHQSPDEVIAEILAATAAHAPALRGVTLERLRREGAVPLNIGPTVPFADLRFPTASGKVELYCEALSAQGVDPLPAWVPNPDPDPPPPGCERDQGLDLITPAAHHFVTSTFANQAELLRREGEPVIEIHPEDAERRGIASGDRVVVENARGSCALRALVTEGVRRGTAASPKGFWSKHNGGRNINWTTSDVLADLAGQSTFHTNRVWVRRAPD
ncbi:MAG: molybdopterin oxidoreductase family protein [Gammaproteobacteria bacterium]|nr:molybdopterin oxidoreductase family protein [Gammaproteobacteria bacterium]NIR84503.1 molybdopterin oxidoreductase family protein [Gammaproteobacteria bacterium]NIR90406.1 molybdopterin oxidoreductase family protein [Gammaproteobacteria bacterium]NIU05554.1 molybdopterin oxidoreductase family protein [Gammaproteobacteria bacterium]NIV52693.1 molybdopterin-dependent oxidoreductase [Gammaproteobacteria bacterium]